jgi:hypothetical protein
MNILGALFGLTVSAVLYVGTAAALGVVAVGNLGALLGVIVSPLVATLTAASWLAVAAFTVGVAHVWGYVVATLGVLPLLAALPAGTSASPPTPLPVSLVEDFARGFLVGLAAGLNFAAWVLTPVPGSLIVGSVLLVTGVIAVIPAVSRNLTYQGIMGWTSWLRPMSWFATAFGLILFVLNLPSAVAAFGFVAIRFDRRTATVETTGGVLAGIGAPPTGRRGFNLGNFTFIAPGPPAGFPFGSPSLSTHETGHTLNAAAFGGLVNWVNALDENPPGSRQSFAYGELTAESHFPRGGRTTGPGLTSVIRAHVRIWS